MKMELSELGYDDWCRDSYSELLHPGFTPARVTRVDRDRYLVRNQDGEVPAEPTGKLIFSAEEGQDLPCVGDWVSVQYYDSGQLAIIHQVLPRKTYLRRKTAGIKSEYQMIASNIDIAFIMQSCDSNFNLRRMERYIVMAIEGKVEPVILLSKSDMLSPEDLETKIAEIRSSQINARIISFSNQTNDGLQVVRNELQAAKTYCLIGSSGVGKTTLLNNLLGRQKFETQSVRESDSRGRHTTTRRQLTILENGALLIDTPGMRELGLMSAGESIDQGFSDISNLSEKCRFADCTHTVEADCAILQAVASGEVSRERYNSYMKLKKESEYHESSYVERRKKDKQFGRMIKNTLEHLKKHRL